MKPNFLALTFSLLFLGGGLSAKLPVIFDAGNSNCPAGSLQYTQKDPIDIAFTSHDSIYRDECYASGFFYQKFQDPELIPGEPYSVYLHFAELFFGNVNPGGGGTGSRVFDIAINGYTVLKSLDIYSMAGANAALVFRCTAIAQEDNSIEFVFTSSANNSSVAAIEIRRLGEATAFSPDVPILDLGLPGTIEWGNFASGVNSKAQVHLAWTTTREQYSQGFYVQMAERGKPFSKIGYVPASGNAMGDYEFETSPLDEGVYYFRIVHTDFTGGQRISPTQEVKVDVASYLPEVKTDGTTTSIELEFKDFQPVKGILFTINGTKAGETVFEPGVPWQLPAGQHPAGVYLLRLESRTSSEWVKLRLP